MKKIPLTQNKFALVDDGDYAYLSRWKWYARKHPRSGKFYAFRNEYLGDYRSTVIAMARVILGLEVGDGFIADHRSLNTLDNRRSNLRKATRSQNQHNRGKSGNNTSGYKGVFRLWNGTYFSQICVRGEVHYLGIFSSARAAHRAYCVAAKRLHGEFARTS
jgi:hypothetical protein